MENPFVIPDLVLTAIGAIGGSLAAYFAWRTYRRKPKLRLTLLASSLRRLRTFHSQGGYFGGQITLQVENQGKIAAKNVVGLLDFDHEHLVPRSANEDGIDVSKNQQVKLQIPSLAPSSTPVNDIESPRISEEFTVRVEAKQSGPTKIRCKLVSDEGAHTTSTLSISVPSLGEYSEQQLTDFLKAVRDSPLKAATGNEMKTTLLDIGHTIGLSEIDLCRLFREVLDRNYLCRTPGETQIVSLLTVRLSGERFYIARTLQLSPEGKSYLDGKSRPTEQ